MKLRLEGVHVEAGPDGVPQRMVWRGQPYRVVEVEDHWRWAGQWWRDGKGWRRAYFRVTVQNHRGVRLTLELFRQGGNWVLSRECD
jgi:hypothetical protein